MFEGFKQLYICVTRPASLGFIGLTKMRNFMAVYPNKKPMRSIWRFQTPSAISSHSTHIIGHSGSDVGLVALFSYLWPDDLGDEGIVSQIHDSRDGQVYTEGLSGRHINSQSKYMYNYLVAVSCNNPWHVMSELGLRNQLFGRYRLGYNHPPTKILLSNQCRSDSHYTRLSRAMQWNLTGVSAPLMPGSRLSVLTLKF